MQISFLTFKAPITTAADKKFCDILTFCQNISVMFSLCLNGERLSCFIVVKGPLWVQIVEVQFLHTVGLLYFRVLKFTLK